MEEGDSCSSSDANDAIFSPWEEDRPGLPPIFPSHPRPSHSPSPLPTRVSSPDEAAPPPIARNRSVLVSSPKKSEKSSRNVLKRSRRSNARVRPLPTPTARQTSGARPGKPSLDSKPGCGPPTNEAPGRNRAGSGDHPAAPGGPTTLIAHGAGEREPVNIIRESIHGYEEELIAQLAKEGYFWR